MEDVHACEFQQRFIDGFLIQSRAERDDILVDEDIVSEQARIEPQDGLKHMVSTTGDSIQVIEFLFAGQYHHARLRLDFLDELDVPCPCKDLQGIMGWKHRQVKRAAKQVEIEVEHLLEPLTDADPQEIAHSLVDVSDEVLVGEGFGNVPLQGALVGVLDEQHGIGPLPVTACPTRLLVILLQGIGDVDMNHQPHIRLVDAHAEGIGRHHDTALVTGPLVLFVLLVLDI